MNEALRSESKILVTGDWQLESAPPCDRKDDRGRSTRFAENVETIHRMILAGAAAGCNSMVFGGDLTEENNPDSATNKAAAYLFRTAIDKGMLVYAMAGNHDGSIYEVSSSSIEPLGEMVASSGKFHTIHTITTISTGLSNFCFVPYLHEASPEQIRQMLLNMVSLENQSPNYLFAHYAVKGSVSGPKNIRIPGDTLDVNTMLAERFKGIFCFHIHKAQDVKMTETITARFPGSPVICNHGERDDKKGYIILDEVSGASEWVEIPQRRRWLTLPWNDLANTWTADDIVKFTGEYSKQDPKPQDYVRMLIKDMKAPEPFHKGFEVSRIRESRKLRDELVGEAGGLRAAATALFEATWPGEGHGEATAALGLVLEYLSEAKGGARDKMLVPESIEGEDFLSHRRISHDFIQGEAELIVGENGKGKTNFLEAVLFVLTGETSKRLPNSMLVRQGAKSSRLSMTLRGDSGRYRIARTLALSSRGATHKVGVAFQKDGQADWASLADGGVKETQEILTTILGASFTSLKATNFAFQNDPSPVIRADVGERRAILAEILGFAPMAKALGRVNELRLTAQKVVDDLKSKGVALVDALNPERRKTLQDGLEGQKGALGVAEADIVSKKGILEGNRAAVAVGQQAVLGAQTALSAVPNSAKDVEAKKTAISTLKADHQAGRDVRGAEYLKVKADMEAAQAKSGSAAAAPKLRADAAECRATAATRRAGKAEPAAKAELVKAEAEALRTSAKDKRTAAAEIRANAVNVRVGQVEVQGKATAAAALVGIEAVRVAGFKKDLDAAKSDLTAEEAKIASLDGKEMGTCPECGAPVGKNHIEKHLGEARQKAEVLKAKISELGTNLAAAEADVAKAVKERDQQTADAQTMGTAAATLDAGAKEAEDIAAGLETQAVLKDAEVRVQTESVATLEAAAVSFEAEAAAKEQEAGALEASEADSKAAGERAKVLAENLAGIVAEGEKVLAAHTAKLTSLDQELVALEAAVVAEGVARKAAEEKVTSVKAMLEAVNKMVAEAQVLLDAAVAVKAGIESKMAGLQASLAEMETIAARLEENKEQLKEKEKDLAIKDIACEGLKMLPGHLIDAKVPEIEDGLNRYLEEFGSGGLSVNIITQDADGKETIQFLVDNGEDPRLDAAAFSGGQLDSIERCINMALADVAEEMRDVSLGFMALDEPGVHLDETRKGKLVEMIHARVASGRTPVTIVISHDRKLKSGFRKILEITGDAEVQVAAVVGGKQEELLGVPA